MDHWLTKVQMLKRKAVMRHLDFGYQSSRQVLRRTPGYHCLHYSRPARDYSCHFRPPAIVHAGDHGTPNLPPGLQLDSQFDNFRPADLVAGGLPPYYHRKGALARYHLTEIAILMNHSTAATEA